MSSGRQTYLLLYFKLKENMKEVHYQLRVSTQKINLNLMSEIITYPSTFLHSVKEVITGERLVFIGWIESYVKSIKRENIYLI